MKLIFAQLKSSLVWCSSRQWSWFPDNWRAVLFDAPANNKADFLTTQEQFVESVKQDTCATFRISSLLHQSHWDSGGNLCIGSLESMPFLCCSFDGNRRSQSQTRKQKKRKLKAAGGVYQLSFEKASPHITCSRFCSSLWKECLYVSNRSRHLVFRIFSTVWKISLRFCQCPRHQFQDLSTLLAVSKASMIPYCTASFSKKAIYRWVRVEVGLKRFS